MPLIGTMADNNIRMDEFFCNVQQNGAFINDSEELKYFTYLGPEFVQ